MKRKDEKRELRKSKKKNDVKIDDLDDLINTNQSNTIPNQSNIINYVTAKEYETKEGEGCLNDSKTVQCEAYEYNFDYESNVTFPLYLSDHSRIYVPRGVIRRVKRLPKRLLNKIHEDRDIAIEKCLLFISNLTSTVFIEDEYWKSLSSTLLHEQLKNGADNTRIYTLVIKALKHCTNATYPLIESKKNQYGKDSYQEGVNSKMYRIHDKYRTNILIEYELKHEDHLKKRQSHHIKKLNEALRNPIAFNLLRVYERIKIPNYKQIRDKAKELVKNKYETKKGKLLTFLNKKSREYFSKKTKRSFVEDSLKHFQFLTGRGYLIPKIGDIKSGGRVVDSFTLMPSWIREMVTIDNENIVELDFRALHPNIALSTYGGVDYQITHEMVAEELKIPLKEVKIEHLSFFNKRVSDMERSILYNYYLNKEKDILKAIVKEKRFKGYKETSRNLFKKEVEIMTTCIQELNRLGIYVIYVYDALYCKLSDEPLIRKIMEWSLKQHKIFTSIG